VGAGGVVLASPGRKIAHLESQNGITSTVIAHKGGRGFLALFFFLNKFPSKRTSLRPGLLLVELEIFLSALIRRHYPLPP